MIYFYIQCNTCIYSCREVEWVRLSNELQNFNNFNDLIAMNRFPKFKCKLD